MWERARPTSGSFGLGCSGGAIGACRACGDCVRLGGLVYRMRMLLVYPRGLMHHAQLRQAEIRELVHCPYGPIREVEGSCSRGRGRQAPSSSGSSALAAPGESRVGGCWGVQGVVVVMPDMPTSTFSGLMSRWHTPCEAASSTGSGAREAWPARADTPQLAGSEHEARNEPLMLGAGHECGAWRTIPRATLSVSLPRCHHHSEAHPGCCAGQGVGECLDDVVEELAVGGKLHDHK